MSRAVFLLPLLCLVVGADCFGQPFFADGQDPAPGGKQWAAVDFLSDDFDGTTLDKKKWHTDPLDNGWKWVGRAPALFVHDTVRVEDGEMKITVGKLDQPVTRGKSTFTYAGAIIRSWKPGEVGWYYECRMKANATVMSSTFWLVSKNGPGDMGRLELDIQECVGRLTDKTEKWAQKFDHIFHSNCIHWKGGKKPERIQQQGAIPTPTINYERFYVYGCWWKSAEEIQFFLDGKYVYSIKPRSKWDLPSFMTMAIEKYDWNPLPDDGGLVASGTPEQRTTRYDWVRTWKLEAETKSKESDASAARSDAMELRQWNDVSGEFSVRARLLGVKDGEVALQKEDGSKIVVSLDRLSDKDQTRVRAAVSENKELNFDD